MAKGDWVRCNKKTMIEEVRSLDIRQLNLKLLYATTKVTWGDGYTTRIQCNDDEVVLEDYYQTIYLERTKCNYGGERVWFLCPKCDKRIAILCDVGRKFLCRHCHDLRYSSQREIEIERMQRKARKIRLRLGASGDLTQPIVIKPKGMHWKTFRQMLVEEEEANLKAVIGMGNMFGIIV